MTPAARMTVVWTVTPGEMRPVLEALRGLMVTTRRARGCLGCSLATDLGDRVTLRYSEEWDSEVALERQVGAHGFAQLLELIERSLDAPAVEFTVGDQIRGLDYAAGVRRSGE